jgi:hypothetical protein
MAIGKMDSERPSRKLLILFYGQAFVRVSGQAFSTLTGYEQAMVAMY